jgi:hypothetical protein
LIGTHILVNLVTPANQMTLVGHMPIRPRARQLGRALDECSGGRETTSRRSPKQRQAGLEDGSSNDGREFWGLRLRALHGELRKTHHHPTSTGRTGPYATRVRIGRFRRPTLYSTRTHRCDHLPRQRHACTHLLLDAHHPAAHDTSGQQAAADRE